MEYIIGIIVMIVLTVMIFMGHKIGKMRNEIIEELFPKKDLPIFDEVKLSKRISIELYDLIRHCDGSIDREDLQYIRLARIINENKTIEVIEKDGGLSLDIELVDFRDKKYKLTYMDIIGLVSSFNYATFVFKDEDKFKLLEEGNEDLEKIKEHADKLISEVFLEVIEEFKESESELVSSLFNE